MSSASGGLLPVLQESRQTDVGKGVLYHLGLHVVRYGGYLGAGFGGQHAMSRAANAGRHNLRRHVLLPVNTHDVRHQRHPILPDIVQSATKD